MYVSLHDISLHNVSLHDVSLHQHAFTCLLYQGCTTQWNGPCLPQSHATLCSAAALATLPPIFPHRSRPLHEWHLCFCISCRSVQWWRRARWGGSGSPWQQPLPPQWWQQSPRHQGPEEKMKETHFNGPAPLYIPSLQELHTYIICITTQSCLKYTAKVLHQPGMAWGEGEEQAHINENQYTVTWTVIINPNANTHKHIWLYKSRATFKYS